MIHEITDEKDLSKNQVRAPVGQKLLRIQDISDKILTGMPYNEIIRHFTQEWGLSERTIKNYIDEAGAVMRLDVEEHIRTARDWHLSVRMRHYRELVKMRDDARTDKTITPIDRMRMYGAFQKQIMELITDMAKLSGLYVEKFEGTITTDQKQYVLPDGTIVTV